MDLDLLHVVTVVRKQAQQLASQPAIDTVTRREFPQPAWTARVRRVKLSQGFKSDLQQEQNSKEECPRT
jgi:hypothetical protein